MVEEVPLETPTPQVTPVIRIPPSPLNPSPNTSLQQMPRDGGLEL